MVHLTQSWSRINSGSNHLEGLSAMAKALEDNFYWLGTPVERIDLAPMTVVADDGTQRTQALGQALRLRKRPDAPIRVLLVGHYDTVYGADHPFQIPEFIDEDTLRGPGVADLKGGLVILLKALECLERSEWKDRIGWEVILNPDEEIGSIGSDPLLKEAAARAQLGLIYEPSLPDGMLAGARKGSGNFTLVVKGRAAHAGRNPEEGRNAVLAASELALAIARLAEERPGILINPARILGGGALNVVPDHAMLRFNVRTGAAEDELWMQEKLAALVASYNMTTLGGDKKTSGDSLLPRDGIEVFLHGSFTRAPKPMCPRNSALFQSMAETARALNHELRWRDTGGACDGNNLYRHGLPNIDTLGVRGGAIHSDQEYAILPSLLERAQLSALFLMQLAKGDKVVPC
jgi:glutamate carboxypeptidase